MTDKEVWEAALKFNEELDELSPPDIYVDEKISLLDLLGEALGFMTREDYSIIKRILEDVISKAKGNHKEHEHED